MATVTYDEALAAFLEDVDAALPRLSALELQFQSELDAAPNLMDFEILGFSDTEGQLRGQSADGVIYDLIVTADFSSLEVDPDFRTTFSDLFGDVEQFSLSTGDTEILRVDVGSSSWVLSSGIYRLEIFGNLPTYSQSIGLLASLLDGLEDPGPDTAYDVVRTQLASFATFSDVFLVRFFEEDDELVRLDWAQIDRQVQLTAEGYTLSIEGDFPVSPTRLLPLLDTGELPFGQIEIIRPDGTSLGTTQFDESFGFVFTLDQNPIPGTYHILVSATNGGSTGFYTFDVQAYGQIPEQPVSLWLEDGSSVPAEILEELPEVLPPEFAPQQPGEIGDDIANALAVPLGAIVLGSIGEPGDVDVFAVDFPAGTNQGVFLGVELDGGPGRDPILELDALVDLDSVTLEDPEGLELLRIDDIDGLEDLEDALLALESELGIAIISDPDDPGFTGDPGGPGDPTDPDVIPAEPLDPIFGWITGDPHLLTLDGMDYDFHAAGEYVLLREQFAGFELQSRMAPVGDNVSANIAAAMRAGDGTPVMIDSADATPLWIGGVNTELADGESVTVGSDRIFRDGDTFLMVFAGADGVVGAGDDRVGVAVYDNRVDIGVTVGNPGFARRFEGLLGDGDGNPDNDIFLADGSVLPRPLTFEDLYGPLRDDWRIDAGQSLFTYDAGETTDGFYLPNFPTGMTSIDDFEAADIEAARQAVRDGGVPEGTANFENAVLDFLLTGDTGFIQSAAGAPGVSTPEVSTSARVETDTTGGLIGLSTLTVQVTGGPAGGMAYFTPTGANSAIMARGDAGGRHSFELVAGESGTVTGMVVHDRARDPAINVRDALDVLRMAIGLDPNGGVADAFDFIAGDLDQNGRVQVNDALIVLRHAIGLEAEDAPRWVYVDTGLDLSDVTASNIPADLGVAIAPIDGDRDIDMQAVLLGNIEAGDLPIT